MKRLRNRLIAAFLAATILPLAATVWITTTLLDRSFRYSTTGELDRLSRPLESTAKQFYQRERDALKRDAIAGRVREDALLYPEIAMDNILVAKQVTEGLNECEQHITLYALDWGLEDEISENNQPSNIPFKYFKELRRLNESRHVPDARFPARHF